jgi:hypothetical protein
VNSGGLPVGKVCAFWEKMVIHIAVVGMRIFYPSEREVLHRAETSPQGNSYQTLRNPHAHNLLWNGSKPYWSHTLIMVVSNVDESVLVTL